jgi:pilus assembly protein Flp/PilA
MRQLAKRFVANDAGATAIEYGLIAALICLAVIGGMTQLGNSVGNTWNTVGNAVNK